MTLNGELSDTKNYEALFASLQRLIGLHRQLWDSVLAERKALVASNLREIEEITFAKQALIEAIGAAERERQSTVAQLAARLRRPAAELSLSNLVILLQGHDPKRAEAFRSAFHALTILIQRITEQNDDNRGFVERSLEHVEELKNNVLNEARPKTNLYSPQGQRVAGSGGARLISKEA